MKYNKLGDYYKISSGGTPSKNKPEYYENGTIPWVKTGDLKEKYVTGQVEMISELGLKNSSARVYPKGTVLLAMYGATIGACSILSTEASCNQACAAFVPNDKILPEYLYIYLCSQKNKFVDSGVGGAQPNISAGFLKTVNFQLETLEKQRRVVEIFDSLDTLVSMHKKQIDKIDFLVKSRFIEMFGEPSVNSKHWKESRLEDVIIGKASNGFFAKPEKYSNDGEIGVICVGDVVNRKYSNIKNLRRINMDKASFKKYKVTYGDILFCRSSLVKEGIAKASIVPKNSKNEVFECHVIRIKLDTNILIPEYMQAMSTTDYFRNQMIRMSKTATMTTIGQKDIISSSVLVPPIEIQNQFVDFATQVDKSKLAVQQSLKELETLKKSLMQQYFG